jgi:glucose/mannose transport system permease protein
MTSLAPTERLHMNVSRPVSMARVWRRLGRCGIYAFLIGFGIFYLMPLLVMVSTSLKSMDEIRTGALVSIPHSLTIQPWIDAWSAACVGVDCIGVRRYFANTFLMVIPATIISTLIGAMNGYALTQFNFRGSKLVYALILFACFTPYQGILIPLAKTLGWLGLAGTIPGLIFTHSIYGLGFTTMFYRNYFISVPKELVRAARVDGAGFFRIFLYIMLPMALPITIVTIIWQFTSIWNDFLFGVSFTTGQNAPIMVALNNIVNSSTGERAYNVDMAAATLAAIPALAIYVLAGKYFVRGLMAGSVKG